MHSLNEQVTVIAAAADTQPETLAAKVTEIIYTISSLTGWDKNESTVYPDSSHKFAITINAPTSGSAATVTAVFNGNVAMQPTNIGTYTNINLAAAIRIRVHKSINEKVTYLSINDNAYNVFLYSENINGETTLYRGWPQSNSSYIYVGANALTAAGGISFSSTSNQARYSIAKFVDNFSTTGGAYHELYWVYATVSPQVHNQLINFDGTIMRLVSMNMNAATLMFAFPVSDTDPNE